MAVSSKMQRHALKAVSVARRSISHASSWDWRSSAEDERQSLNHRSTTTLYPGHMPTSALQKAFVAGYAAITAVRDPERGDMVAALGETTGLIALRRLRDQMRADPIGRELLRIRPVLKEEVLKPEFLKELPEGSFGREYARFMCHHGFSADDRSAVKFVDDAELAFVMQRYRQVHDFWHVLCGLPPNVLGELALKWFEMVQTRLPVAALSALFGPLALPPDERRLLREVYVPWAVASGAKARPLMNVWYEKQLSTPVEELRRQLYITPAPRLDASEQMQVESHQSRGHNA